MLSATILALVIGQPADPTPPDFEPRTCQDRLGRTIRSYLSPPVPGRALPIAVLVMGSGGQSVWPMREGKVGRGLQNLLLSRVKDHLRVLVVEKPGVSFGFSPPRPGSAEGCSPEFLREHTLERWTAAVDAALTDALSAPGVDRSRVAALGHSEGGIVAAKLAAANPAVTDVALLAGGGPNQAVDLAKFFGRERIAAMMEEVKADPESTTKFALGHPYRRWSSFLATSTLDEILKSKTRVFVAQGAKDSSVDPAGADLVYSRLKEQGRDAVMLRVEGGDHGFSTDPKDRTGAGFIAVFDAFLSWFQKG